jgi:hypothetical protein
MFEIDSKAARPRSLFQDRDGCVRHFRPDAIAAEYQDTECGSVHGAHRAGFWVQLPGVL